MSITLEKKQELIKIFATSDSDTGSVYVQCAILTERIKKPYRAFSIPPER